MLTDDDLNRLLTEAGDSYELPAIDLPVQQDTPKALWQRRGPQLGAVAAAVIVGALLVQGGVPTLADKTFTDSSSPMSDGGTASRVAGSTPEVAPGSTAYGLAGPVASGATAGGTALTGSAPPPASTTADTARIVKTGTITLAVDEGKVSATMQRLQVLVTGARGYVANSTSAEAAEHPTATITVRVPVTAFESVVAKVRALNATVVSAETSGQDVTASYADTQAQIASLKAARSRFLAILAGAKTIAETLSVQQRVDDVQGKIDRLEGQRRVLADQSDLATLTVSVGEKGDEVLTVKERSGWSKAWDDATHGFTSGVQSLIAHSGRTLLVLLVGAALLLLARSGWRLARRRLV